MSSLTRLELGERPYDGFRDDEGVRFVTVHAVWVFLSAASTWLTDIRSLAPASPPLRMTSETEHHPREVFQCSAGLSSASALLQFGVSSPRFRPSPAAGSTASARATRRRLYPTTRASGRPLTKL